MSSLTLTVLSYKVVNPTNGPKLQSMLVVLKIKFSNLIQKNFFKNVFVLDLASVGQQRSICFRDQWHLQLSQTDRESDRNLGLALL